MFGSRTFMDGTPLLGRGVFESLGQGTPAPVVVQAAPAPAPVVIQTPAPEASLVTQIGTLALIGGIGLFALEITGVTHLTPIRKYVK